MLPPAVADSAFARAIRARALWGGGFAAVGFVAALSGPAAPAQTPEGVASMLGAAVEGEVRADDFVWEARGGFWRDAFIGRRVLFLAKKRGAGAADLYRARVRLSRGGRPLALRDVRNLTHSPLGDDRDLVAAGHHAAYVTSAFGVVQGVTLLDLDGDPRAVALGRLRDRVAFALGSWLTTGDTRGIARTEVTFGSPPPEAREELQGDRLVLSLGKDGLPAALGVADDALNTGAVNVYEAVATRLPRRVPALGEVVAGAVGEVLGETAGSAASALLGTHARPSARRSSPEAPRLSASAARASADGWPPPAMTPLARSPVPGEGVWIDGRVPAADGAPPCVLEAAIRPDASRPESWVRLYALDTRQLDLRLVPGVEEPASPVGLHGTGRIADAASEKRAVAWFSAGPASPGLSPAPGFVADRRVLVPLRAGLAAIAITGDGRAELGPLNAEGALPAGLVSVRQTPDALLGWTDAREPLPRGGEIAERSALGLTASGQLVYAWGADVTAGGLAKALELAGARFAVPLAGAGAPSGFAYLAAGEAAAPGMSIASVRAADASPNDVLVAVRRADAPPPLASGAWAVDGGKQPSPAWIPSIFGATVVSLGAQVRLTSFAPGRLAFRMRPGAREPATKAVALLPGALAQEEQARVVAAVTLAAGRKKGARGLVIEGAVALPVKADDAGALAIDQGRVRVVRASEVSHGFAGDAAELPMTADDGKLRPEAREVGTMRPRSAACSLEDGTFIVGSTTFDSDEAATTALLDLGCSRVVALDRGTHQAAQVDRAGTQSAPEARYEATVLFALEVPLTGRAAPLQR